MRFHLIVVATLALPCVFAQETKQSAGDPAAARALANQYCATCHSVKAKMAGVVLEGLDWSKPAANAAVLEKVLRKVRSGEMPPAGMPHPAPAASAAFTSWLEAELDAAAAVNPNPGRPSVHRLNRAEYSNAIRDLLAVDVKPGATLPVDDSGYGFDNVADVLSISPALLERYMSEAKKISRLAVGDLSMKPAEEEFEAKRGAGRRMDHASDDLPFNTAGGIAFQYYFPLDGEYTIRVKMAGTDGTTHELRVPVKAGLRTIGATFPRESYKPELEMPIRRGVPVIMPAGGRGLAMAPPSPARLDVRLDGVRLKSFEIPPPPPAGQQTAVGGPPQVDKVTVGGPYNPTGRGDTPSRNRIFVCRPASKAEEEPCAQKILANLTRRAYRRPSTEADVRPLLAFYRSGGRAAGDFDQGIEKALRAVLISPNFLFRVEHDPPNAAPGTVYRINDFELASRLSFFLWSSIPDETLYELAEHNRLHDPAVLQQQVRRMLDDRKSDALVSNFAGQWLYLRNLDVAKPDPDVFPDYDDVLKEAFRKETELFFANVLREDHSVLELLDANYTFLNQRLAEHYGIPNVYGPQFRKVTLSDPNRGGILGQGSVLTVTSYPNRTSVVQRGKWILETLLGTPPPPPPPDVPDLKPHGKDGRLLSLREQMEQHRANAVCASCHSRMDPLGFALENYDGVGKWRTKDAGVTIDPSGKLPDGSAIDGPAGLKKVLLTRRRDDFANTVAEKLLVYALGRGLEYYDKPAVRAIAREAAKEDYRMSVLIAAVVKSTPFQMRRTQEQ